MRSKTLEKDSLTSSELDRFLFYVNSSNDINLKKYINSLVLSGKLITSESNRNLLRYLKSKYVSDPKIAEIDNLVSQARYNLIKNSKKRRK